MNKNPSRPGPATTSCLTCKHRRKNCDRIQPTCEACTRNGFTCLGYARIDQSFSELSNSNSGFASLETVTLQSTLALEQSTLPRHPAFNSGAGPSGSHIVTGQSFDYHDIPFDARCSLNEWDLCALHSQPFLPCPLKTSLEPDNSIQMIGYIRSEHKRAISLSYFKPSFGQMALIDRLLNKVLQTSPVSRLSAFIGCKILQSSFDGTTSQTSLVHIDWLDRFEQRLHSTSARVYPSTELQERLASSLQVAFLKLRLRNSSELYSLMMSLRPTAQQMMLAELGSSATGFISMAHVLASNRFELGHFMLIDTLCSVLHALPPALNYDTSILPFCLQEHPMEAVHGCPTALYFALVKINALFHQSQTGLEVIWQPIEQYLKSWQPVVRASMDPDSRMTVARMAVQESWRHTLLIYLYMVMGGVASDDPRIQESVQQVFRLIASAPQSKSYAITTHLVVQCIIAGACARSEKQRTTAREVLDSESYHGIWIIRGKLFAPVLDHLWHGVAANGAPIRWTDYMHSRRVAAPVVI